MAGVCGAVVSVISDDVAKAIAVPYSCPLDMVSAFVHYGEIIAEDCDGFMSRLLHGVDLGADGVEASLVGLLREYVAARIDAGMTGPVAGWSRFDSDRELALCFVDDL